MNYDGERQSQRFDISILPGEVETVDITFSVPAVASEGDSNMYNIRIERNAQDFKTNNTRLTVRDEISFDVGPVGDGILESRISDQFSFGEVEITNTGNVPLSLTWTHSLSPDGWQIGYSNPVTWLEPRQVEIVQIGVIPPANQQTTDNAFTVRIDVLGTNAAREYRDSTNLTVAVVDSAWSNLSAVDDSIRPFKSVNRGDEVSMDLLLRNDGNMPLDATLITSIVSSDGNLVNDWTVSCSVDNVESLEIGSSQTITVLASPNSDAEIGNHEIIVQVLDGEEIIGEARLEASVSLQNSGGGIFAILPPWLSITLSSVVLIGLVVVALRLRKTGDGLDRGEELVSPNAHVTADLSGERRKSALDIGNSVNEQSSGSVSEDEIAAALAQSLEPLPSLPGQIPDGRPPGMKSNVPAGKPPAGSPPKVLPPLGKPSVAAVPTPLPVQTQQVTPSVPPLPAQGLPAGWTIEQWNHYGWEWIKRNQS